MAKTFRRKSRRNKRKSSSKRRRTNKGRFFNFKIGGMTEDERKIKLNNWVKDYAETNSETLQGLIQTNHNILSKNIRKFSTDENRDGYEFNPLFFLLGTTKENEPVKKSKRKVVKTNVVKTNVVKTKDTQNYNSDNINLEDITFDNNDYIKLHSIVKEVGISYIVIKFEKLQNNMTCEAVPVEDLAEIIPDTPVELKYKPQPDRIPAPVQPLYKTYEEKINEENKNNNENENENPRAKWSVKSVLPTRSTFGDG
jgi:hypothetical protein